MKSSISIPVAVVIVAMAGCVGAPCAAMPVAPLAAASDDGSVQQVNGVRHHHRHHFHLWRPLLEVYPGLYYGCRPGWYCFGPPLRPNFRRAWYGGFNSIYGYQGARWRPPRRSTGS